jgi:hypothetical protein
MWRSLVYLTFIATPLPTAAAEPPAETVSRKDAAVLTTSTPGDAREGSRTLWDVADAGGFDRTNKGYSIDNGRVVVDLHDKESPCPIGFRRRSSVGDAVTEIAFRYRVAQAGRYWLQILWHPGASGKEQFEVLVNGAPIGTSRLVDGSETPNEETVERFCLAHQRGQNEVQLRYLSGDGLRFRAVLLATGKEFPAGIKKIQGFPTITTAASYERVIGEPGVMMEADHVRFYAPKKREEEARIVHGYLVRAYNELHQIVGVHTKDKIVVYALPEDSPYRVGRTTQCKIWYTYKNLIFESQPEWQQHRVPHVSGYIEEMAHNFVGASLATFGNEAVGWSISKIVSEKVAGNPIHQRSLVNARKIQTKTFAEYKRLDNTFPKNIAPNLCDRIHAYLLYRCQRLYGPRFWSDFFKEVRNVRAELQAADRSGPGDQRRNARYRITIDCFDRLMKGQFKKMLKEHEISLTTDVRSIPYKSAKWKGKLR